MSWLDRLRNAWRSRFGPRTSEDEIAEMARGLVERAAQLAGIDPAVEMAARRWRALRGALTHLEREEVWRAWWGFRRATGGADDLPDEDGDFAFCAHYGLGLTYLARDDAAAARQEFVQAVSAAQGRKHDDEWRIVLRDLAQWMRGSGSADVLAPGWLPHLDAGLRYLDTGTYSPIRARFLALHARCILERSDSASGEVLERALAVLALTPYHAIADDARAQRDGQRAIEMASRLYGDTHEITVRRRLCWIEAHEEPAQRLPLLDTLIAQLEAAGALPPAVLALTERAHILRRNEDVVEYAATASRIIELTRRHFGDDSPQHLEAEKQRALELIAHLPGQELDAGLRSSFLGQSHDALARWLAHLERQRPAPAEELQRTLFELSRVQAELERWPEAVGSAGRLLELSGVSGAHRCPDHGLAVRIIATGTARQGKVDEALAQLEDYARDAVAGLERGPRDATLRAGFELMTRRTDLVYLRETVERVLRDAGRETEIGDVTDRLGLGPYE